MGWAPTVAHTAWGGLPLGPTLHGVSSHWDPHCMGWAPAGTHTAWGELPLGPTLHGVSSHWNPHCMGWAPTGTHTAWGELPLGPILQVGPTLHHCMHRVSSLQCSVGVALCQMVSIKMHVDVVFRPDFATAVAPDASIVHFRATREVCGLLPQLYVILIIPDSPVKCSRKCRMQWYPATKLVSSVHFLQCND